MAQVKRLYAIIKHLVLTALLSDGRTSTVRLFKRNRIPMHRGHAALVKSAVAHEFRAMGDLRASSLPH